MRASSSTSLNARQNRDIQHMVHACMHALKSAPMYKLSTVLPTRSGPASCIITKGAMRMVCLK